MLIFMVAKVMRNCERKYFRDFYSFTKFKSSKCKFISKKPCPQFKSIFGKFIINLLSKLR